MRSEALVRASKLWGEGETGVDIARTLGLDADEVYMAIQNHRDMFPRRHRPFAHVDDAEKWRMVEMRSRGMSYREIGRELGRDMQSVRRWCSRAGVA